MLGFGQETLFFSESLAYIFGALEVPLHTQARANLCSIGAAEVIGNLYLTTQAQVLAAEVLAYIVPELWLGDEYRVAGLSLAVAIYGSVGFPPEISEAVKLQSLYAEKVVAGPYGCQLHRNILVGLADGLIENVQIQGVLVGSIVNQILHTEEPGIVDRVVLGDTDIVLYVQAPVL